MLVYTVRISGVKDGSHEDYFDINGKFFESFVNADITNCKIKVISILIKDGNKLKLNLSFKGEIYNLLCDFCASEMSISVDNSISVLLHESEEKMDDTDKIIYIKPNQHKIDISQLIYEGIVLSIPSKKEHLGEENDKCDNEMKVLLDKYAKKNKEKNDPRWDKLNKLKDLI
jgi:uncharacterized metal-binding protein YceD (DUF177 family)